MNVALDADPSGTVRAVSKLRPEVAEHTDTGSGHPRTPAPTAALCDELKGGSTPEAI